MKYSCKSLSSQNVFFFVMELKLSKCLFCNGAQALNVKNRLRSSSSGWIKLGQNHLQLDFDLDFFGLGLGLGDWTWD